MIRWTTPVSRKRITYQTERVGITKLQRLIVQIVFVKMTSHNLSNTFVLLPCYSVLVGSLRKTYWFHPQWPTVQQSNSSWVSGYLKLEPRGCSETTNLRHVISEKSEGLNYTATEARNITQSAEVYRCIAENYCLKFSGEKNGRECALKM